MTDTGTNRDRTQPSSPRGGSRPSKAWSRLALLVLLTFTFTPQRADAQHTQAAPAPEAPSLIPPSVAQAVQARYPAEALAQRLAASVELLLTIAVDGSVLEAQVVQPAGHGFDGAAREALLAFRFEPARKDGQPVVARIRYRYDFTPPEPPEPMVTAPALGALRGSLRGQGDLPVAKAEVSLVEVRGAAREQELNTAGATRTTRSDAQGNFAFAELAPGLYQLHIYDPVFEGVAHTESVQAGEETQVAYRLVPRGSSPASDGYEARAVVEAPTREVTRRTLDRTTMYRIPGTGNDPIRAVEVLPGVARPPFGSGQLIIRGSSPEDSQAFVDGMPIPQLYHFGGLRSVYNAQLLRQVSLYPGNFSSRYGRKSGGVFDLETREAQHDRLHGVVDVSALDGTIMLEGPITRRFSLAGSIRRSLFDLVLRALSTVQGVDTGFTALPAYYDYQLIGSYRGKRGDSLQLSFYGSNDHLGLLAEDDQEANAVDAANAVEATQRFNFAQLSWKHAVSERTDQRISLQTGPTLSDVSAGDDFRLRLWLLQIQGRAEWLTRIGQNVRLINGIDLSTGAYRAKYQGPAFGQSEGDPNEDVGGEEELGAKVNGAIFQPGAYTDLGIDLGPVTIDAALRADYYHEIRNYSLDPRLVTAFRVRPEWTLKLGAGLFSQPPAPQESHPAVGNEKLDPIHVAQFAMGIDYVPVEGVKLGVEGFYKQIWDNVVVGHDANDPKFVNEGTGRIFGFEASAQVQPNARYAGILSYTLLESERRDHPGERYRPFDYRQTHGLALALLYLWPRGWDIGATFRYYSGNPYTPITGRVFDATERGYRPVYGAVNSAQNPAFNRLDLRVQKTWKASKYSITGYLDVQNALNIRTQEAYFFNYDYTQKAVVRGLPVIPALGVRGQF